MMRRQRAFTLIELMVVVAVLAIIAVLAAPSFRDFILVQRLKGINAQVVTDLQFARSEAATRGIPVRVRFQPTTESTQLGCYIIYSELAPTAPFRSSPLCDCKAAEGSRCSSPTTREIRTVQIPLALSVSIALAANRQASDFYFDPRNGGLTPAPVDFTPAHPDDFGIDTSIDSARALRNLVSKTGRVKVCKPAGSTLPGEACPW